MIRTETIDKRAGWVKKITAAYKSGVLGIIQIGTELAQARAELPPTDFWAMVESDLPFGKRSAERYMAIAGCKWIATHVSHLPPASSTLYAIAVLPDALRESGLRAGAINPNMEREDVAEIKERAGIGTKPKPRVEPRDAEWTEAAPKATSRAPATPPASRTASTATKTPAPHHPEVAPSINGRGRLNRIVDFVQAYDPAEMARNTMPRERMGIREQATLIRDWLARLERALDREDEMDRADAEEAAASRGQ